MTSLQALDPRNLDRLIQSLEGIASELGNALTRLSSNEITNDAAGPVRAITPLFLTRRVPSSGAGDRCAVSIARCC
jgi:hypothetical protein